MLSNVPIKLHNISKVYKIYHRPIDRLLQMLPWNKHKSLADEFWALKDVNLEVRQGEVIGVVGQNGAGKSTLLQLVCKTLEPSSGSLHVKGKVSALLELGSGFNPEFTGRENVYMSAAISGLSKGETDRKYADIVEFSGVSEHIDNPVKTYSSGMMLRLAFAVATSIEPDILVIDEALSVGDGAFARKSFDRIMSLKDAGCTILFCSHSLYQVEVLCDKVMWIDKGKIKTFGEPSGVVGRYQKYLDNINIKHNTEDLGASKDAVKSSRAKILKAVVSSDDGQKGDLQVISDVTNIHVEISFKSDVTLPVPSVAVIVTDDVGRNITSCGSFYDKIDIKLDKNGEGKCSMTFPKLGLRKGKYYVYVFLLCEKAIHIYESIQCGSLEVTQKGSELGIVSLPREWS